MEKMIKFTSHKNSKLVRAIVMAIESSTTSFVFTKHTFNKRMKACGGGGFASWTTIGSLEFIQYNLVKM
jgi:hypothetical protein